MSTHMSLIMFAKASPSAVYRFDVAIFGLIYRFDVAHPQRSATILDLEVPIAIISTRAESAQSSSTYMQVMFNGHSPKRLQHRLDSIDHSSARQMSVHNYQHVFAFTRARKRVQ
jgi:hypothetical protein